MRNSQCLFILILSSIIFVQCDKKEQKGTNDLYSSDETINIDEVLSFTPSYLLGTSTIIYKNSIGEKMVLKSTSGSEIVKGKVGDIDYSSQSFETRLYSESDALINITLKGSGNPYIDRTVVKSLTIMLMPFHPSGNLFLTINFKDGEPSNDLLTPTELQTIELLGKSFERVFKGKKEESDSYSEIYFSPLDGIIAFRDGDNELWVLDEVIE